MDTFVLPRPVAALTAVDLTFSRNFCDHPPLPAPRTPRILVDSMESDAKSPQMPEEELSQWRQYWALYQLLPPLHKRFLSIVLLQCAYVLFERIYVLVTDYDSGDRSSIWFFIVILVSLVYIFYFAFHAILHVNVSRTPLICV